MGIVRNVAGVCAVVLLAAACNVTFTGPGPGPVFAIYVADFTNARIVQFRDMTGTGWTTKATAGPAGIDVLAGSSTFFVASDATHQIQRWDGMSDTTPQSLGTPGSGVGQFLNPRAVSHGSGNIHVADTNNHRIVRTSDNMTTSGWVALGGPLPGSGVNQFNNPHGIVRYVNDIYVADTLNHRIVKTNPTFSTWEATAGGQGVGVLQFNGPRGVAFGTGHLYIADTDNHRIARMDTMTGTGWMTFGTQGSGVGQFNQPLDVAVDEAAGKIYVTDSGNNRIIQLNLDFSGWTAFGQLGSGTNQFNLPWGIAVRS